MQSNASTVVEYLNQLPDDRRTAISKVRDTILNHLPKGFEEVMNWGMITYQVPLKTYPDTYNGKALMYAALASQKHYMAVYLTGIYMDDRLRNQFEQDYKRSGKRLNAGKSCVRFKKLEDLPLDVIGKSIAAFDVEKFLKKYEEIRDQEKRNSL